MQASDITYSFPLGPTYQDKDGDKVLIVSLPSDTKLNKFIGICNGDMYPYDAEELEPYVEKEDFEIVVKESELRAVLRDILTIALGDEPNTSVIDEAIQRLSRA